MKSTIARFAIAAVIACACATPASATHTVWLDFSNFDLSAFPAVNGSTPPTPADTALVQELVVAHMLRDYANYDVVFTLTQPVDGPYSAVYFHLNSAGGLFGCAGASCCQFGNCTGIGSWTSGRGACEVYVGSFRNNPSFQGPNATAQRIANGVAGTASHELGHVLGLTHCFAADDFADAGVGCTNGYGATLDLNQNSHIMATGATGITGEQRASSDRFFSIHSSRRRLTRNLQGRSQASPLADTNGDGHSDLTYGCLRSMNSVHWYGRRGGQGLFGIPKLWSGNSGSGLDVYLLGDVTGDGRDDLVIGSVVDADTVSWRVRRSNGSKFGKAETWNTAAGRIGDRFYLGDMDGDGRKDLLFARAIAAAGNSPLDWFVATSSGASFGEPASAGTSRGTAADRSLLGDIDGDGRVDLVSIQRETIIADVFVSNGSAFVTARTTDILLGFFGPPDVWMLADVTGDGMADLLGGTVTGSSVVPWQVAASRGECPIPFSCFEDPDVWSNNAGNAGDIFRTGFGPEDARADLFYGRAVGQNSLVDSVDDSLVRWHLRASQGTSFGPSSVAAFDAGAEGWMFP
jgi:hypothetical protein